MSTIQAHSRVLCIPELLDNILSFLPQSFLLLVISRICKSWNAALESPTLQKVLCFRSEPYGGTRTWSTLLERRFGMFFNAKNIECPFSSSVLRSLPWNPHPEAFTRADASWRRMLVFQPACTRFDILETTSQRGGCWYRKCTIECEDGIRMGMLWDIVQEWCSKQTHWFKMTGLNCSINDILGDVNSRAVDGEAEGDDAEGELCVERYPGLCLNRHKTLGFGSRPLLDDRWISQGKQNVKLNYGPLMPWLS